MKKIGLILGVVAAAFIALAGAPEVGAVSAAPSGCSTFFYANGTPVTIDSDGAGGTVITWTENGGGSCTYTAAQAANLAVAGGYNNNYTNTGDDSQKTSVSITMNGGVVRYMNAGGENKSYVTTADITINGGTITGFLSIGGYGSGGVTNLTDASSLTTAMNVVENGTITVNNASNTITGTFPAAYPIIYAGGDSGYSHVGTAVINVHAGDWARVVGGGSAGYVGSTIINITGGHADIVQGLNRGQTDEVIMNISGGTITDLYAFADGYLPTQPVLGTVDDVTVNITGGVIDTAQMGYDVGGVSLNDDTVAQAKTDLTFVFGTITDLEGFDLTKPNATMLIPVTIDDVEYLIEEGKTLADYNLNGIRVKDGYTFKGFVTLVGDPFAEDVVISEPITLVAKFELIPVVDENPDTSDNIALFAMAGVLGVIGLGVGVDLVRSRR